MAGRWCPARGRGCSARPRRAAPCGSGVPQRGDPVPVWQLQHPVPARHREVVEVRLVDHDRAVERPRDQHGVDGRAGFGGAVEERARRLPGRGRRVGLVATAEALDDDRQPAHRAEPDEVVLVLGVDAADRARGQVRDRARAAPPGLFGQRRELVAARQARRHRAVGEIEVGRGGRRRHAGRAGRHGLGEHRPHGADLVVVCRARGRVGAHDPAAQVRVADVAREVDAQPSPTRLQELRERHAVVPRDGAERDRVHVLDPGEDPGQELAVVGLARCDGEPAVPGDDGRDAVEARHRGVGVERDLRVVVRVRVDDPGRHDAAVGVEHLAGFLAVEATEGRERDPSRTPTSTRRRGSPVPSTTYPPRTIRS